MTKQALISYINTLPGPSKELIQRLRQLVFEAAPDAQESLKYGCLCFMLHHREIFSCGVWPAHFTIYPVFFGAPFLAPLEDELLVYRHNAHDLLFPLEQPPYALISKLIASCVGHIKTHFTPQ